MDVFNNYQTVFLDFICKHMLVAKPNTLGGINIQIPIDGMERLLMKASRRLQESSRLLGRIPCPKVVPARMQQPVKATRSQ